VAGTADNRGEDSAGGIIAGETSLAHTRPVVNDKGCGGKKRRTNEFTTDERYRQKEKSRNTESCNTTAQTRKDQDVDKKSQTP
jgi:hypothetical protein